MANFESARWKILSVPAINEEFYFNIVDTSVPRDVDLTEIAKEGRDQAGQFATYQNTVSFVAQQLVFAINDDYGSAGRIEQWPIIATANGDEITVTGTAYDLQFDDMESMGAWIQLEEYIPEVPPVPDFSIGSISAQAADVEDRNTHARFNISVDNDTPPFEITSPVIKSAATEADLYYDYLRNPPLPIATVSVTDDNLDVATTQQPSADLITLDSVTVLEGVGASTVTINTSIAEPTNPSNHTTTNKEYSINNQDWQVSANFENVLANTYTAYVRDDLGALIASDPFIVGTIPPAEADKPVAYFDIPSSNPLRMVKDIDFNCGVIPNWQNALFAKLLDTQFPNVEKRYYNQLITDCDNIVTQVHSNYEVAEVKLVDCDDNEIILPLELKQTYVGLEDLRDCSFKQISSPNDPTTNGRTLVYFSGGDVYDPDTEEVTQTNYIVTKSLPKFAEFGTLFTITGTNNLNGTYKPIKSVYDSKTGYWGIALDQPYIGGDATTGQVKTLYNEQDYNVYEYTTIGASLDSSKLYRTEVIATDPSATYPDVSWTGEPIKKLDSTDGTVAFDYRHSSNTSGLDFSTLSAFRLRLSSRFIDGIINEETNAFTSETGKKNVIENIITESVIFEGMLMPFYQVRKLAIASGMDGLMINSVDYVLGDDNETESLISQNNPFQVVTRSYQLDDSLVISDDTGLVTETRQVIGSSVTIAIGDNI
jgi:hypothetical protein